MNASSKKHTNCKGHYYPTQEQCSWDDLPSSDEKGRFKCENTTSWNQPHYNASARKPGSGGQRLAGFRAIDAVTMVRR
jgi:hypothetical protein